MKILRTITDEYYIFSIQYLRTGELFAEAPIEEYPGVAVEQVLDSSRYFVLQIKDPSGW